MSKEFCRFAWWNGLMVGVITSWLVVTVLAGTRGVEFWGLMALVLCATPFYSWAGAALDDSNAAN